MTTLDRLTQALADRYRVEHELGQGGMATVYLAHDLKHDRLVAIKVLKPELGAVIGAERFLAEIKVTANLQHPNLLPLFDSGETSGLLYYVMPYVERETLRTRMTRERQLPVDETVRLTALLAGALDYAHARGVIHRDLKPENILLQAGQPVIADFGIALAVANAGGSRVTETGLSLGTPHYMSPEQASGDRALDARSDQYSLAAVTYEMLTGEPPHTGATAQAIIVRLMTESPRPVRASRPAAPEALDRAIGRALSKTPADRFGTCGDFARALTESSTSGTFAATEGTSRPHVLTPSRPRRALLAVGALCALLLAIAAAWALSRRAGAPSADNSVGVMAFDNLTHDTAYAYLAEGLSSEIATSLARVPRLEVRSPGSVRSAQRGNESDPREVGRRLNVRNVVEGEFQQGGDRIRIAVRLVAVPSGTQRWSESWTRPVTDLLTVQEEIARAVAKAIAGRLLPEEQTSLAVRPTDNPEAYDHFLRGNFHLARRSSVGVTRAIQEYETAVRLDSSFARADARIALAYGIYAGWGWDFPGVPRDSQIALGFSAANRALMHDSTLADGWMARGVLLYMRYPRTLDGAEAALRRATALDSGNAEAWHQYGAFLQYAGPCDSSLAPMRRALALEPGRAVTWTEIADCHAVRHRDGDALAAYDSALASSPDFYPASTARAWLRVRLGDKAGARADAEAALRSSPEGAEYFGLAARAAVAADDGDSVLARRLMQQAAVPFVAAQNEGRPATAVQAAMLVDGLAASGQRKLALDWLERIEPRGALLWWLMQSPQMDPLREDPRFKRVQDDSRAPGAHE